ncbi:MAG TPA: hypothetical protein VEL51_09330 [Vicinamibacterales bacterium]|nr:hypothetical protein [Vicinamibacterales bacterium]
MTDQPRSHRRLDSLKKEAKRWLHALRVNDADARARFERALADAPAAPTLRDVQLALARENGFAGWSVLKEALERTITPASDASVTARYETMAEALLEAYRTGTPEAMERHYSLTWHRRSWQGMRTYVQMDLGKRPSRPGEDVEITLDDARYLIAREHGVESWDALKAFSAKYPSARPNADSRMTDALLREAAKFDTITVLALGGCREVTDEGIQHLARLPRLTHLDLSGTGISDRSLQVLRHLPALETLSLAGTRITDEGIAHLAHCHELQDVNLSWTRTGDGALRALAGKQKLYHLATGNAVTDAGIRLLHEIPIFKRWHGGTTDMALLSYSSKPNHLMLRGTFTDRGMQHMHGLDGLFGLNLDDSALAITAKALEPLASLPNLGWLGVDAKDDWMPYIAAMPKLRFLGAQDTSAGDDGFVALSRSQTIEYIWGRRCHNLQRRGFMSLASMPSLRGLSVSCLNVDDAGVSALPSFPALRELMPMDVPDAGYRHIGKCERLESLVLMYCRDTTDAATEHITGLRNLAHYFNSYTTITDRTPELLSGMESLERVTFDTCHGVTNAGLARLARLPRLRELRASGRGVTPDVDALFSSRVRVWVSP